MAGWSWDTREPYESRCDFIDEVFRGGYEIDELHNQVRGPVAFEGMQHAGNARYAIDTPRVSHCMVGNVPLSCDLGPQIAGVAKFDEEFRPDIRKNGPGPEADSGGLKRAQASQTLKSSKSYCPISNVLKTLDSSLSPLEPT